MSLPAERILAAATATPSARRSLTVVVPVHDEEAVLGVFLNRLLPVLAGLGLEWDVLAVDDGSSDGSLALLRARAAAEPRLRILVLARSFGKDAALTAGLDFASGDAVVPMDADLQDPPELLPRLVAAWRAGADVVDAVRVRRPGDAPLVRASARAFYLLMTRVLRVRMPAEVGDFRLIDRRVVAAVGAMREQCRFMKGLVAWPGFRTAAVPYERPARADGRSSWSPWRLWNFALDGIVGFSSAPLRVWLYVGTAVSALAVAGSLWLALRGPAYAPELPGLLIVILLLGGLQLLVLGLMGEYLGRMHGETKHRPLYIVADAVGIDLEAGLSGPAR